jgi:epoxide hydrolase-like predicted phosphatase
MIRAVVFDFGNVIDRVNMSRFVEAIAETEQLSLQAVQELMRHSSPTARQYESGEIGTAEFYERIAAQHRLAMGKDEFLAAFGDIFTPIPATHDLVRALKPFYRLGLLSNTNEWHFEHGIQDCPVYPLFDAVTVSFAVGSMKPAEPIYRDILAKLDVPAGESVYIDDLHENVEGAKRLGMEAVRYSSHEELLHSLRSLGVRCV